jgi:hypothetical protein
MSVHRVPCAIGLLLALGFIPSAGAEEMIRHRFLALDFWHATLHHVDQLDPAKSWVMPSGGGVKDMQLIGQGRLMISAADGYVVYDLAGRKKLTEHHDPELAGTVTARRRPDGSTWLGTNAKQGVTIFAVGPSGQVERRLRVPGLKTLRLMRFTPENTLLLAELSGAAEITLDPSAAEEQRIVRRFQLPRPRNAYMALKSADGTCWVAGGYTHALYQYRADATLLRTFEADQPPGFSNWFYAGFQLLQNGHVVQANWTGHNEKDFKEGWKAVEFDRDGRVVWHWQAPREQVGSINGLIILDDLDPALLNDDVYGVLRPEK